MGIASRNLARHFNLPVAESENIHIERDIPVPVADGVVLLADRYAPLEQVRPPLVMVRSPYGRRGLFGTLFGRLFAERGFQVLMQSCRGTFGSGGVFDPLSGSERDDGLATIRWMRRQPWYPGAFGTAGPSYLGMVQWAIARDAGPEHKAMAVQACASDFSAAFYPGGSFSLETALRGVYQFSRQERRFAFLEVAAG